MKKLYDLGKSHYIKAAILVFFLVLIFMANIECKTQPKEIKIGAILPLTGDAANYGQNLKKGIDLALQQINENGGVAGKKISILYSDSRGLPADGVSAFKKLIDVDKVNVIIGDATSSVTLAIAPLAEKQRVVVLSPLASAPSITSAGDFIFRNVPSDYFGGKVAAMFSEKVQGWQKLAILYINNDFGVGLKETYSKELESLGSKVVSNEAYEQGNIDFRAQLIKIKSTDPEAIFLIGYSEVPQILIQAKEIGIKAKFLGTGLLEDPNVVKLAKGAAEGLFFTQFQYDAMSNDLEVEKFVKPFKEKYNAEPNIIAAYGFDAIKIIAFAMKKSDLKADGIKEQLYQIKDFHGVTGRISFDKNGDVVQPMGVKVVNNGKFIWVKKDISIE